MFSKLLALVFCSFFILCIALSYQTMTSIPFHDFDEANRAEAAKNMKEFGQWLAPVTGSPFLRVESLSFPVPGREYLTLFHHLERPPLVYWSMIVSTNLLGQSEFAYRLPSLIFGMIGFVSFLYFTYLFGKKFNYIAAFVSLLVFLTSLDWWLSSQYALLDTALSSLLLISVLSLVGFLKSNRNHWLLVSGVTLGLAILSKGPPAVIYMFPLLYLLLLRKLSIKNVLLISLGASVMVIPWILASVYKFGIQTFVHNFLFDFVSSRANEAATEQQAPLFWYGRWWMDSFRLGIVLFGVFLLRDSINFIKKKTTDYFFLKTVLLVYILPSFLLYSIVSNKVWWYVLPLIPAISFYIYLNLLDFIRSKEEIVKLSFILFISSLPFFYGSSNSLVLAYSGILIITGFIICYSPNSWYRHFIKYTHVLIFIALLSSLSMFYIRFPVIQPTYVEAKEMGHFYKDLDDKDKCLLVDDMPYESILFYSNAKEVNFLRDKNNYPEGCSLYLITPVNKEFNLLHKKARLYLYKI